MSKHLELKRELEEIDPAGPWTLFWDMHSGGSTKLKPFDKIYIQADEKTARVVFYNLFRRNPERVTCTCCGEDYSISESATLDEATEYHRQKRVGQFEDKKILIPLIEYVNRHSVLVVTKDQIEDEHKKGRVPQEGYVWQ